MARGKVSAVELTRPSLTRWTAELTDRVQEQRFRGYNLLAQRRTVLVSLVVILLANAATFGYSFINRVGLSAGQTHSVGQIMTQVVGTGVDIALVIGLARASSYLALAMGLGFRCGDDCARCHRAGNRTWHGVSWCDPGGRRSCRHLPCSPAAPAGGDGSRTGLYRGYRSDLDNWQPGPNWISTSSTRQRPSSLRRYCASPRLGVPNRSVGCFSRSAKCS